MPPETVNLTLSISCPENVLRSDDFILEGTFAGRLYSVKASRWEFQWTSPSHAAELAKLPADRLSSIQLVVPSWTFLPDANVTLVLQAQALDEHARTLKALEARHSVLVRRSPLQARIEGASDLVVHAEDATSGLMLNASNSIEGSDLLSSDAEHLIFEWMCWVVTSNSSSSSERPCTSLEWAAQQTNGSHIEFALLVANIDSQSYRIQVRVKDPSTRRESTTSTRMLVSFEGRPRAVDALAVSLIVSSLPACRSIPNSHFLCAVESNSLLKIDSLVRREQATNSSGPVDSSVARYHWNTTTVGVTHLLKQEIGQARSSRLILSSDALNEQPEGLLLSILLSVYILKPSGALVLGGKASVTVMINARSYNVGRCQLPMNPAELQVTALQTSIQVECSGFTPTPITTNPELFYSVAVASIGDVDRDSTSQQQSLPFSEVLVHSPKPSSTLDITVPAGRWKLKIYVTDQDAFQHVAYLDTVLIASPTDAETTLNVLRQAERSQQLIGVLVSSRDLIRSSTDKSVELDEQTAQVVVDSMSSVIGSRNGALNEEPSVVAAAIGVVHSIVLKQRLQIQTNKTSAESQKSSSLSLFESIDSLTNTLLRSQTEARSLRSSIDTSSIMQSLFLIDAMSAWMQEIAGLNLSCSSVEVSSNRTLTLLSTTVNQLLFEDTSVSYRNLSSHRSIEIHRIFKDANSNPFQAEQTASSFSGRIVSAPFISKSVPNSDDLQTTSVSSIWFSDYVAFEHTPWISERCFKGSSDVVSVLSLSAATAPSATNSSVSPGHIPLNGNISLSFLLSESEKRRMLSLESKLECSWLDSNSNNWTSSGCTSVIPDEADWFDVLCVCDHLTDFSVVLLLNPAPYTGLAFGGDRNLFSHISIAAASLFSIELAVAIWFLKKSSNLRKNSPALISFKTISFCVIFISAGRAITLYMQGLGGSTDDSILISGLINPYLMSMQFFLMSYIISLVFSVSLVSGRNALHYSKNKVRRLQKRIRVFLTTLALLSLVAVYASIFYPFLGSSHLVSKLYVALAAAISTIASSAFAVISVNVWRNIRQQYYDEKKSEQVEKPSYLKPIYAPKCTKASFFVVKLSAMLGATLSVESLLWLFSVLNSESYILYFGYTNTIYIGCEMLILFLVLRFQHFVLAQRKRRVVAQVGKLAFSHSNWRPSEVPPSLVAPISTASLNSVSIPINN